MWECPDFFALDDRQVLLASVWDMRRLLYAAASVGTYQGHRFTPHVTRKLDHGDGHYYAPQSTRDRKARARRWLRGSGATRTRRERA
jgi:beta-fructofuranosidase